MEGDEFDGKVYQVLQYNCIFVTVQACGYVGHRSLIIRLAPAWPAAQLRTHATVA